MINSNARTLLVDEFIDSSGFTEFENHTVMTNQPHLSDTNKLKLGRNKAYLPLAIDTGSVEYDLKGNNTYLPRNHGC